MNKSIFYNNEDRGKGPFILRQSGTSNFVSKVNIGYYGRFGTPGESACLVKGWDNPDIAIYSSLDLAIESANHVSRIEGIHISVEIK